MNEQSNVYQRNLNQIVGDVESRHHQILGSIQSQHLEDMSVAQSRHETILQEAEQRVHRLIAQEREMFERDRRDLINQLIQMTQERDQLRHKNSQLSHTIRGFPSAAHSAPSNPAQGFTSAASYSAPHPSALLEMPASPSPQLNASGLWQPGTAQTETSVIATLQGNVEQLTSKVIELQSQLSPKRSRTKRGKSKSSHSSEDSVSSSLSEDHEEYELEKKRMRIKSCDKLKLSSLPKTASDFRPWQNALFASIAQCSKQSEERVYGWLHLASGDEDVSANDSFPILSRVLGTKLLELSKGSRFQLEFQSIQEKDRLQKRHPSGLVLLQRIERGMALNSQHLLALKPAGNEIKDLESFRDKALYVLSGLDEEEQLNEGMLRPWLYEALKKIPAMQFKIEKFREAPPKDPIRTFDWLWSKLGETLDEAQHDTNSTSIMTSLTGGRQVPNAALKKENDSKKEKDKDKNSEKKPKKSKETKSPSKEVDAAAIKPKAKPPDPKAKPKSTQPKVVVAGETGQPCLFFPSGTCRRDPCPFVHDTGASSSGNPKAKASPNPKGKALPKAVSHATAAATVLGSLPGAGALKTIYL